MSAPQTPHTKYRTLRARPVLEKPAGQRCVEEHRIRRVKGCDIQALERSTIGAIEVNLTLHILTNLAFNLVIRKWPELVDMEAGISTECGKPRTVRSSSRMHAQTEQKIGRALSKHVSTEPEIPDLQMRMRNIKDTKRRRDSGISWSAFQGCEYRIWATTL